MALITCQECKKEISESAKKCPHCGFELEKGGGCLPIIIIGAIVIGAISSLSNNDSPSSTGSIPSLSQSATGACMGFIKQVLNDPASAEFGVSTNAYVNEEKIGEWTVRRDVRAKNALNAIVLSTFECKMTFDNQNWHSKSIKEIK